MAGDSLVAPGDSLVARLALHEMAVQAVEERRLLQQVDQRPVVERVHHDILPVVIYILEPLPEGLQHPPSSQSLWQTLAMSPSSPVLAGHAIHPRLNDIKA